MSALTIYKVEKNSFTYKLVYGSNDVKIKESKNDWTCVMCQYNTSKNTALYQISNDQRFHRVCSQCLLDCDFVDFCFGEGTATLCSKL